MALVSACVIKYMCMYALANSRRKGAPDCLIAFVCLSLCFSSFYHCTVTYPKPPCFSFPAAGWSEGFTESGEKYYFNDHEQTSTWDKPSAVASMGGSAGEQKKEQLLPPGELEEEEEEEEDNVSFPRTPHIH